MKIACLLITHLAMKSEFTRFPELQNRPVIITQSHGSRQTVLDRSQEANGVTEGMSVQEALSCCKSATLLEADHPYYEETFNSMLYAVEQRSPEIERGPLGCAYIGIDGLEMMYGGEARLITSLIHAIPNNFTPRLGLASGKFPAYIAAISTKGGQATKVPNDIAAFLKRFSIDLLPLPWNDKVRLHNFSIHTLGDLSNLSLGAVQAQFGTLGKIAWELSRGIDTSPLTPTPKEESITESLTFPSPVITQEAILAAVEILITRAFLRPEVRGKNIRGITLKSSVTRHPTWQKQFTFKDPTTDVKKAYKIIKTTFENIKIPGPLEDITLSISGLSGESGIQTSLFTDIRKRAQLREMMNHLESQLGHKPPIYQVKDIEPWSRTPERRQVLTTFEP